MKSTRNLSLALLVLLATFQVAPSALAAEKPAPNREIRGTVVDSSGKPVPHADVYCSSYVPDRFPTVTVQSNAEGKFAMTVPPADEFEASEDYLWAFVSGHSTAVRCIPSSVSEQSSMCIALGPPGTCRINVVQPNGKPAQNARIAVRTTNWQLSESAVPDSLSAQTAVTKDDRGNAIIPAWSGKDIGRIEVTTLGFGPQVCWHAQVLPDTSNIILLPVGKLRGRVIADGPYPVQGLCVSVQTWRDPVESVSTGLSDTLTPMTEVVATTDSQGCFRVPQLGCGRMSISIRNGVNKPYQYRDDGPKEFHGEDAGEVVVRLRKAAHIHGILRVTGEGVTPSQFGIWGGSRHGRQSGGHTDARGDWTWPGLTFSTAIDDAGNFDVYSWPGEVCLCVHFRREPELSQFPNWAGAWSDGRLHFYASLGRVWCRLNTQRDQSKESILDLHPTWTVAVGEQVEEVKCPPLEVVLARGRAVGRDGKPLPNIRYRASNGPLDNIGITDGQGRFRVLLDRRLEHCALSFNMRETPDDTSSWAIHPQAVFQTRHLLNGVIPDVILPAD